MSSKRIAKMIMKLIKIKMVRPQNEKLKKPRVKVISNGKRGSHYHLFSNIILRSCRSFVSN